jgi:hypothetical protein
MKRAAPWLAAAVMLVGCGSGEDPEPGPGQTGATLAPAPLPQQGADFPELASRDCAEVVEFYLEALGGREWARAALVWDDPVVDGARLEGAFGGYRELQLAWSEPVVEGAAGSLYCTVSGTLTDAQDPAKSPMDGTLLLRRANDVAGATAAQLRWTLRASTFVERLERSDRGEP